MRYQLARSRSTLVIEARSSVGEIVWESVALEGHLEASLDGLQIVGPSEGSITLDLAELTSGNTVYDGELLRRIDARRHPRAHVELTAVEVADPPRYQLLGNLTFHGVTRPLSGDLEVELGDDGELLVTGSKEIDIRMFGVPAPRVLMLKIYPDVRVSIVAVLIPVSSGCVSHP